MDNFIQQSYRHRWGELYKDKEGEQGGEIIDLNTKHDDVKVSIEPSIKETWNIIRRANKKAALVSSRLMPT
jgi:hypothetical protein